MENYTIMDTASNEYMENTEAVFQEDLDNAGYFLEAVVNNYEKHYKTNVEFIAWVGERFSQYGSISHNGATAVAVKEYDPRHPERAFVLADHVQVTIETGKDGGFNLTLSDHDGTNSTQLVLITESMLDKWGGYYRDESALQLAPERKPITISDKFFKSL